MCYLNSRVSLVINTGQELWCKQFYVVQFEVGILDKQLIACGILVFFQNEEVFVELDELDRITHA